MACCRFARALERVAKVVLIFLFRFFFLSFFDDDSSASSSTSIFAGAAAAASSPPSSATSALCASRAFFIASAFFCRSIDRVGFRLSDPRAHETHSRVRSVVMEREPLLDLRLEDFSEFGRRSTVESDDRGMSVSLDSLGCSMGSMGIV